eukprot:TCONS_00061379-protein
MIYSSFIESILAHPMTEQVCFFLVPAISPKLSLQTLSKVLVTMDEEKIQSVWMLYSLLSIIEQNQDNAMDFETTLNCTKALRIMIDQLRPRKDKERTGQVETSDSSDESSDEDESELMELGETEPIPESHCQRYVSHKCVELMSEKFLISPCLTLLSKGLQKNKSLRSQLLIDICHISHHMLYTLNTPVQKSEFLYSLAFSKYFLRLTWYELLALETYTNTGKTVQLLHQLAHGNAMTSQDEQRVIPMLSVYTTLLRYAMFSIYDTDFYSDNTKSTLMPFRITEVIEMSRILRDVVLGLIVFMYPDIKMITTSAQQKQWHTLCRSVTLLVKQLYARDSRRRFCPEHHWLSNRAAISHETMKINFFVDNDDDEMDVESDFSKDHLFKPGLSTLNARNVAILEYVPFAVPFLQRVLIFQRIIQEDKKNNQTPEQAFISGGGVESLTINRKYLYQDAFDQLSKERRADIKQVVRVQMINAQGLDEAGIDGGGVFREFMSQFIKEAYD